MAVWTTYRILRHCYLIPDCSGMCQNLFEFDPGSQISSQVLIDNLASPFTHHSRLEYPVPQAVNANLAFDTIIITEHIFKSTPQCCSPIKLVPAPSHPPMTWVASVAFHSPRQKFRRDGAKKCPIRLKTIFLHCHHRHVLVAGPRLRPFQDSKKEKERTPAQTPRCLRTGSLVIQGC